MNKRKTSVISKVNERRFDFLVFIFTFLMVGALFTVQMKILGDYINYTEIPFGRMVAIIICWVVIAAGFSIATVNQINRQYRKPMEQFAEAAEKVAGGDFSVYVPARHRADRSDYIDSIFLAFNKMVEELGSIETLKTDFFSNVSHEIKTPLAVIQNYAEMLQNNNLSPERRQDYARTIVEACRRLSDLITNILKLNKLEKQNISPVFEPYDLSRQLAECALLFEDRWEKKDIEFVTEIEDEAPILADASLLELVWNNLLSNAIKFTPEGGTVTLRQFSGPEEEVVSVTDTGCGMDEETTARIFDKFYQGDTSHSTEGNGLGLALAFRIVNLMDGTITVESELGVGTTFTVRLPARRDE